MGNESFGIFLVFFYSARTLDDFAYVDIFQEAWKRLQIQTIYVPSDIASVPSSWKGERGLITPELITKYVPDHAKAVFYISGPHVMVTAFKTILARLGVARNHIKTDFFPGVGVNPPSKGPTYW